MKKVVLLVWILAIIALLYFAIFCGNMWLLLIAVPMLCSLLKFIFSSVEADIIIPIIFTSGGAICLFYALFNWNGILGIIGLACLIGGFVPAFFKEVFTAPTFTEDEIMNIQPKSKGQNDKDASVVGRAVVGGIIAGGAGAIVGALSAVDKNNRNAKNDKK